MMAFAMVWCSQIEFLGCLIFALEAAAFSTRRNLRGTGVIRSSSRSAVKFLCIDSSVDGIKPVYSIVTLPWEDNVPINMETVHEAARSEPKVRDEWRLQSSLLINWLQDDELKLI